MSGKPIEDSVRAIMDVLFRVYMDHDDFKVTSTLLHDMAVAVSTTIAAQQQGQAVAWCQLTQSGKIAYFDGKPMIMVGPVGNEHHPDPLHTAPPPSVPEGWVLVPREPTEAMNERASLAYEAEVDGDTHSPNVPREAMRAALNAALATQQPAAVDEAMVERATMALLGKSHDTAPGIDWRCDRAWTVNKVRKHMRAALTAALATQHQEPTT